MIHTRFAAFSPSPSPSLFLSLPFFFFGIFAVAFVRFFFTCTYRILLAILSLSHSILSLLSQRQLVVLIRSS